MSHQLTPADCDFNGKHRQTRKAIFLSRMAQQLPWQRMLDVIDPVYPKVGNGCRPYPQETHIQQWYKLSNGAMEDAPYDVTSIQLLARFSLNQAIPDRTTIMNFRHRLTAGPSAIRERINQWLSEVRVLMIQGSLVDATIIEAPCSTKNKQTIRPVA